MAFSRAEFFRGAIASWLWFIVVHQLCLLLTMGGYGVVVLSLTLPWSFGALLIGSPLAYLIGRALRGERRRWVHELIFGLFGLVVGVLTTALAVWLTGDGLGDPAGWWPIAAIMAASACPAVVLGWRFGARETRGPETRRRPRRRVDPDAEHEDSATAENSRH
ncbi:hypothetical protein SRABI121_02531 [Microbacterium sp. Bi121]|nr:hypothetical protein SRABI121_02531 [Microbacterium sp. Bi121]